MPDAVKATPDVAKGGPEQVEDGPDVGKAGVVAEQADGTQRLAGVADRADVDAEAVDGDGKPSGRMTLPKPGQRSG